MDKVYGPPRVRPIISKEVTVGIPTKNRYDILSHCLLSIAQQTYRPKELIIVDDTPEPVNLTTLEIYEYALRLLEEKGIKWRVIYGMKKGQHHSHQIIQDAAETDFVFRIDDDEIAEPTCIEKLLDKMSSDTGAVAPLVLMPNPEKLPAFAKNDIRDLSVPNVQWFKWPGTSPMEVDHLYSCFLYRKGIVKFDTTLSNKAHREETIFTYSLKREGFKLLVNPQAVVWHWRKRGGGIRSDDRMEDYLHDEAVFNAYKSIWGVDGQSVKTIVLDNGIGDHWAFKNILPELRTKYGKLRIAACFPDVFWDEPDLEIISIADAIRIFGDITPFNVYRILWDSNEKMHLIDGFRKLYL